MLAQKAQAQPQQKNDSADLIYRLQNLLSSDMEKLTEVILNALDNDVELIPTIAKHLILAGGKRLRPLLTIACYHLLAKGNASHRIIELAAAIEFIHNATLLHDDVVDASTMRRGRPTANVLWGNKASILVGDFLFAKAFELMLGESGPRVLPILAKVAQTITEGEVFQLSYLRTFDMTENHIMQIIGTKTAALFSASCEMGAALLDLDEKIQCQMHEYGYHLGIAFQLIDDILDYTGNEATLGKSVGDDLSEGKVTMPLFIAYERSSKDVKDNLQAIISKTKVTDEDFRTALQALHNSNAIDAVFEMAHNHAMEAVKCLAGIEDHEIKSILEELPKSILLRQG